MSQPNVGLFLKVCHSDNGRNAESDPSLQTELFGFIRGGEETTLWGILTSPIETSRIAATVWL